MSKRHMVTQYHVITIYNDMFDHMDGVLRALAKKKMQWKEDLYFAVKFARQKLSKSYTEVTPTTGMLLILAHILDPFHKLRSFRKWDKGMDINPEDETSYTTQYQEAFLKYVENEYCAKRRQLSVTKHEKLQSNDFICSATPSQSGQSCFDPYDLSSGDEEYLMPKNLAETTPGRSDRTARSLTPARLYLNSPPESPKNWGQVNPNLNDYQWRLAVHFGFRISRNGGDGKRKRTQSTRISPMWHATYSQSYLMVSEWRPVFPLDETLSAGGSQKPQAKPFRKWL